MLLSIDCRNRLAARSSIGIVFWMLASLACPTLGDEQSDGESSSAAFDPQIKLDQPGVDFTLVAEHPDVVTPTGIDVDEAGAIWVVASHTHFRPDHYGGPEHDEILVFDADGSRSVFYAKTDATMDLELGTDGWVYVAQRDRIMRIRDSDNDGKGDTEETIASLASEADYPHNGLSGLTWSKQGDLIFALGENYAKPWTLTGSDGSQVQGSGEGGIFVCDVAGRSLRRIAKGFWNPFGICIREDGSIFAAENDPGSRPPCRLLHVVEGGDYGYQRRYGNASYHPFVCWDGELTGTLPMLHAVGEAPCGIVPLGNGLLVTSWTEHRIDFYPLSRDGASFATERITLVRGGDDFRPTCIAAQSATTFYLTDWVEGSYEIHGKGRVWRLTIDPQAAPWLGKMEVEPPNEAAQLAESLRGGGDSFSLGDLFRLCRDRDPFLRSAAIRALANRSQVFDELRSRELDAGNLVSLLLASKEAAPDDEGAVAFFLSHPDPTVQFEAMRWIADSEMTTFLPRIKARLVDSTIPYRLFEAALATSNALSGTPELGVSDAKMLMSLIQEPRTSPRIQAFALRLLDPRHPRFTAKTWNALLQTDDPQVTTELVRSVATVGSQEATDFLLEVLTNTSLPTATRADALAGLSGATEAMRQSLLAIAEANDPILRDEAIRSLRFAQLSDRDDERLRTIGEQNPTSADLVQAAIDPKSLTRSRPDPNDFEGWKRRLTEVAQPIDLEAGRRLFHHSVMGTCVKCHRHSGRGSDLGPDLSAISSTGDPDRLLRAFLQPSRDVDPQYHPRMLVTEDGKVFTGILLRDGGGGNEFYRDQLGREQMFKTEEIVQRKELSTSMMPDGLYESMTDREIRDLLAFIDNAQETTLVAAEVNPWLGTWWLDFDDGYGGWLEVQQDGGDFNANLLWRVGSARPVSIASIHDHELVLERKRQNQISRFIASIEGESIRIRMADSEEQAIGGRCPPMPQPPDLASIKFGEPISLFNGQDLGGWRLQPADARNGWRVADGNLINETPKTDFSAYGEYGNLRTEATFGDCQLHVEFNVASKGNSGLYVRGLYEAQVVDRDSPMQGISGPGAIFGRIEPSQNAGLPGGQWQSYDITLVDRHLTVRLNGKLVIDNQPVAGCTGGALFGNVSRDGPVYLQGDHTSVRYRNLQIRPRIPSE